MSRGRRYFAVFVFAWLALAVAAEWAAPRVIRSAYRGESLPALNRLISGQAQHSVDFYVKRWNDVSRPALLFLAIAAALALVVSLPRVQRRLAAELDGGDARSTPDPVVPNRRRKRWIYALIFAFLGGTLFELAWDPPLQREHWPWSPYQMYSKIRKSSEIEAIRAFGITAEEPSREFPIVEEQYSHPLGHTRFWVSLARINQRPDRERLLGAAFADTLRRYEEGRREGRHQGPPLRGMRLYRLRFVLDASGLHREPTSRELLYEVFTSTPNSPSS